MDDSLARLIRDVAILETSYRRDMADLSKQIPGFIEATKRELSEKFKQYDDAVEAQFKALNEALEEQRKVIEKLQADIDTLRGAVVWNQTMPERQSE